MSTPPFDLATAQRWFAIEANNRAWDLLEKPARSPEEDEELIHVTHASVWHWAQAGGPIHRLRGLVLLATAYAAAKQGETARRYSRLAQALLTELADQPESGVTTFDRATVFGCAALALRCGGRNVAADELLAQAKAIAAELDPDDRAVVEKFYG